MVHLAIDDHSRVSFAHVLLDEKAISRGQFLRQAVAYYARLGVRIERVMTDNGKGFNNDFKAAREELGIRYIKTRPYTPKTNGKAERFVQTSLREWAYAKPYETSTQREAALQPFLHRYKWHRPHGVPRTWGTTIAERFVRQPEIVQASVLASCDCVLIALSSNQTAFAYFHF